MTSLTASPMFPQTYVDQCLTGRGLFAYQNMDDILAAVDAIESDYVGHCRAAQEIAEAYFDSKKVLTSLMAQVGMG